MTAIVIIKTLCNCRVSCQNRKCHDWVLECLETPFGHELKLKFGQNSVHTHHSVEGGTAPLVFCDIEIHTLFWWSQMAYGTLIFKKTYTVMATVQGRSCMKISYCSGEVLYENQPNLHFDPQLPGFWVAVNIINSIARGDSICAGPTKSGPWGVSTVAGEHLQKWHVLCWMLINIYW